MVPNKFTEEDKAKVVEFLNFIATKATFSNWKTEDSIKHFKLLAHMQQVILTKIDSNILEVGAVKQMKPSEEG